MTEIIINSQRYKRNRLFFLNETQEFGKESVNWLDNQEFKVADKEIRYC